MTKANANRTISIFIFVILIVFSSTGAQGQDEEAFEFTDDFTTVHVNDWLKYLGKFKGHKHIKMLEIGSYEGRSTLWFLQNILTGAGSEMTANDLYKDPEVEARFLKNLKSQMASKRVKLLKGPSQEVLRSLPLNSFDIVYIDGSHYGPNVMIDAIHAFQLAKVGGVIIFDDFDASPEFPSDLRPQSTIRNFLRSFRDEVKLIQKGYWQVIVEKLPTSEKICSRCSRLGPYIYHWHKKTLLLNEKLIPNIDASRVEKLLRFRETFEEPVDWDRLLNSDDAFKTLKRTLGKVGCCAPP